MCIQFPKQSIQKNERGFLSFVYEVSTVLLALSHPEVLGIDRSSARVPSHGPSQLPSPLGQHSPFNFEWIIYLMFREDIEAILSVTYHDNNNGDGIKYESK
jgi:hypothetical protein